MRASLTRWSGRTVLGSALCRPTTPAAPKTSSGLLREMRVRTRLQEIIFPAPQHIGSKTRTSKHARKASGFPSRSLPNRKFGSSQISIGFKVAISSRNVRTASGVAGIKVRHHGMIDAKHVKPAAFLRQRRQDLHAPANSFAAVDRRCVNHHRYPVLDSSLPRPADQGLMPTVDPVENPHGQYRRRQPKRLGLMYLHLRSPFRLIRDTLTLKLLTSVHF